MSKYSTKADGKSILEIAENHPQYNYETDKTDNKLAIAIATQDRHTQAIRYDLYFDSSDQSNTIIKITERKRNARSDWSDESLVENPTVELPPKVREIIEHELDIKTWVQAVDIEKISTQNK